MPYIKQEVREALDGFCSTGRDRSPQTAGELNYVLTKTIIDYALEHKLSYQVINDIIGALEGAKAEFQRRIVTYYEDAKIKQNGDVYPDRWPLA